MGLALHKIWQISELPIGDVPYEEYFSGSKELEILASQYSPLYHTLRDLTYNFCIYLHLSDVKGSAI